MKDYEKTESIFQHVLINMEREYHSSKSLHSCTLNSNTNEIRELHCFYSFTVGSHLSYKFEIYSKYNGT